MEERVVSVKLLKTDFVEVQLSKVIVSKTPNGSLINIKIQTRGYMHNIIC